MYIYKQTRGRSLPQCYRLELPSSFLFVFNRENKNSCRLLTCSSSLWCFKDTKPQLFLFLT